MIEIIKDDLIEKIDHEIYRLIINYKNTKDSITISPFQIEHYNDIDLFNIKIFCDKNNLILRVLSTMNYLPVNSQYADELIIIENQDHMKNAYFNHTTVLNKDIFNSNWKGWNQYKISTFINVNFKQVEGSNILDRKSLDKSGLIDEIYKSVTKEELIDFINNKKILIRESSFNLFNKLNLPKNIFLAEIKPTFHKLLNTLKEYEKKYKIFGLDYKFQQKILEKTKHHFMSIQILGSEYLNWKILAAGGSARLFSMMPTKNILLMARDLYGNDPKIRPKKVGWISNKKFPWMGNQIAQGWTLSKIELDTIFGGFGGPALL